MKAAGSLLRGLSYLFHLALCLFFLGLAILTRGASNLQIPELPWQGEALNSWLLWLSLAGLIVTLLAILGRMRFLFPLWALFTLGLAFWGFFLNPRSSFDGEAGFKSSMWFLAALLIAALVSLPLLRPRRRVS